MSPEATLVLFCAVALIAMIAALIIGGGDE